MKLTYWTSQCLDDSDVYSIRERTKKAAQAKRDEYGHNRFGPVKKVTIEYDNAFDLLEQCSQEDHHWWEAV